jgi:hypothetical protein
MIIFEQGHACANDPALDIEQARLAALLSDMGRLRVGVSPEHLAEDAPFLDRWTIGYRPVACLVGLSTGHPLLPGDGRQIATSDLILMSQDRSWARTLSRWYRLGRPADGTIPDQ